MSKLWAFLLLSALAAGAARAQERALMASDEALSVEVCEELVKRVMPGIERFARMKFRRRIPVRIEPKVVWLAKTKQQGFGGFSGRHALAFYTPSQNTITIIPWTMGYDYKTGKVREINGRKFLKGREEWIEEVEPTVIHELTHGIHHQNFYSKIQDYQFTMQISGLSDHEIDRATVSFLLGEGFAEFVSLRTTAFPMRMDRHPRQELSHGRHYMRQYQPNGKEPYRIVLSKHGYNDGLDLLHHLSLTYKAGPRGVRGILYRMPPRRLLFQPAILAKVELDDPPEPDSIFWELYPWPSMAGVEIRLAVNPGKGRYFSGAYRHRQQAEGCLLGYVAEADGPDGGMYRYAIFIADPDNPGHWSEDQANGLKNLEGASASEKTVPLPLTRGVKAKVVTVKGAAGGRYIRAESEGLVILAHESKPTGRQEERVLRALRALYIKRPTKDLYTAALKEAMAALEKDE